MRRPSVGALRLLSLLVIAALLAVFVGYAHSGGQPQIKRLHPAITALAADNPDQLVAIIFQHSCPHDEAERLVEALGGTITKDLPIIHAVGAEMRAAAVLELAQSETVRWIALDAPVVSAAIGGKGGGADISSIPVKLSFNPNATSGNGVYGHGAHVTGITAGPAPGRAARAR